ncbi:ABC transporter permease subunit [Thermococcus sp. AM4]|uniref:ABC transporter permease subunit n=1 Tax=Thermococcus sp. (strain AM4) TaxID=246969 RepID=UPI00018708AB|nr:ABC transporter permease subunit [Thermococcus sp. AM4]EEB73514.1 ABC-type oligopeptide transport system, permease protein [Thermococcus sp. AM4]
MGEKAREGRGMRIPRRVSIALIVVIAYVIASLVGPLTLRSDDLRNWNNLDYWEMNPKAKPPEWYGAFKGLPPSEWLRGKYREGVFRFTYDFHYGVAPEDVVIVANTTKSIEVTLTTPDNETIRLFAGSPGLMNYTLHLGENYPLFEELAEERCGMRLTGESFFGKNVLNIVFSEPKEDCLTNPKPLYGRYVITVKALDSPIVRLLHGGRVPRLEPNETMKVFIAGQSHGLLGTDTLGRDVWVGFLGGMGETLLIAFAGALISVGLGLVLGTLGAIGGKAGTGSNLASRFLTVLPTLPFAMVTIIALGTIELENRVYVIRIHSLYVALVLGILLTGNVSRNVRSIVKEELRKGYTESSKALGGSLLWILRKHVSRILIPYSLEQLAIAVPGVIALLTLLGFFNISPGFNWSSLMSQTIVYNAQYQFLWWLVLPIGVSMGLLAISFVVIANWIEEEFIKV